MAQGFSPGLVLEAEQRVQLWNRVVELIAARMSGPSASAIDPLPEPVATRAFLGAVDFDRPWTPLQALDFTVEGLDRFTVHTDHPGYLGRFNPAPSDMGIVADALVALFNPQLAAWTYGAFGVEIESLLIRAFGERFGWAADHSDGTFASGSAEANHTAILAALTNGAEGFPRQGLAAFAASPRVYVSAEGHHSVRKAARLCGLGDDAVVAVDVDSRFSMSIEALRACIDRDRSAGHTPLMVVATAGTTGSGGVDPIRPIADLCEPAGIWLHVDAAWGGPLILLPEKAHVLAGSDRADSITFDAHKWLSVPMGAGIFLTRHPGLLSRTFGVDAGYMPSEAEGTVDPYAHSMQWSRRFIGLKLFMTLATVGWEGYRRTIRRQLEVLEYLVGRLVSDGWQLVNDPDAGVACFVDGTGTVPEDRLPELARAVVAGGRAWVTHTRLAGNRTALRLCITNFRTTEVEVDALAEELSSARMRLA